jgi:hypothetical protein
VRFDEVDVSEWPVVSQEPGGVEPKYWITRQADVNRRELDRLWLFKPAKIGLSTGYRRYDDVAELLASALATAIGLPAAEVEFAQRNGDQGIISRNITPTGWELHPGDTRLSECPGYVRISGDDRRPKNRVGHNLANIRSVLTGCTGPPGAFADEPAFLVFAGYLVFDAWIANTDRHAINWAVLEREGRLQLAPSFDHGTALASGVREGDLESRDPIKFAHRGMATRFENGHQRTLVDFALEAVDLAGAEAQIWLERIARFDQARLDELLDAATNTMRLSVGRRTFLEAMLGRTRGG